MPVDLLPPPPRGARIALPGGGVLTSLPGDGDLLRPLADSTLITENYIKQMAEKYFVPQSIVIGHLNHLPVTHVYGMLLDTIRSRNLRTVTLNDVFLV